MRIVTPTYIALSIGTSVLFVYFDLHPIFFECRNFFRGLAGFVVIALFGTHFD
jgi:hypothetical protein